MGDGTHELYEVIRGLKSVKEKGESKMQVRQKSEKWLIKTEELINLKKNFQTICIQ